MTKFIGERGPSAKLAKKEELQAEIRRYESALVIFGEAGDPAIVESIKAKLKTAEEALAKATKDAPSQDHELKAVQEAKSSYEVFVQARKDREVKGAQKATEREKGQARPHQDPQGPAEDPGGRVEGSRGRERQGAHPEDRRGSRARREGDCVIRPEDSSTFSGPPQPSCNSANERRARPTPGGTAPKTLWTSWSSTSARSPS